MKASTCSWTCKASPGGAARHPGLPGAPIQAGYLACRHLGPAGVDWIIADRFVMPAEVLPNYSEKPIYLPHCYQVSDWQRSASPAPTRAQAGCRSRALSSVPSTTTTR